MPSYAHDETRRGCLPGNPTNSPQSSRSLFDPQQSGPAAASARGLLCLPARFFILLSENPWWNGSRSPCTKSPVWRLQWWGAAGRDASGMTYFAQQGGIASGSSLGQPEGLRDSSRWSVEHRKPSARSPAPWRGAQLKEWHPFRVQT